MIEKRFAYVNGISDTPLLGDTIGQNLRRTVGQYPEKLALVFPFQQIEWTYQQFWDATTELAKALLATGLRNGDRLGIWSPNRYEWTLVQYATARIGVILVNVNPAYKETELTYVLNQSGCRMLISARSFKTSHYEEMWQMARANCSEVKYVCFLDKDWDKLLAKADLISDEQLEKAETQVQFDDPVNIQYTSGTTGFPKGVTLSHHNIQNNGYFIAKRLHYTDKDLVCIPVPFYHCFGMVIGNLACTSSGATMVVPSEAYEPEATLQVVEHYRCTSLYGVPTMFIAELNLPNFSDFDLSSLRTGIMAGSPCPEEIMRQVQDKMYMKEVGVCYGMTETSPVSTQTIIGAPIAKQVSTVGTVMDHLEIKIIDPETGAMKHVGEKGELCTRGYSVMLKYWNNPDATTAAIDGGRWMHSGDEGLIDEEGYIKITGRIKDVILRGGENISPKEIEDFIYLHEAVEDVQVIGVPHPKFGEEVMAWVKVKKGMLVSADELKKFCKEHIAYFKVPKYWKFVDSFPMTVTGKIRKGDMRAIAIKELGLEALVKI